MIIDWIQSVDETAVFFDCLPDYGEMLFNRTKKMLIDASIADEDYN